MNQITKYFPNLTTTQLSQMEALPKLYDFWNAQINVISRKDIENIYEKHILHALSIAKFIEFKPTTEILDLGTGGGFPGIPLAILFPQAQFHLVDSIGKKNKVTTEIYQELDLKNVETQHTRAESLDRTYEFVVTRAVASLSQLYTWIQNKISPNHFHDQFNGLIALKGGDLSAELKEFPKKHIKIPISKYFKEDFFQTKDIIYVPMRK